MLGQGLYEPMAGGLRRVQLTAAGEGVAHYYRFPAWSPNGRQVVYEAGEIESDIWEVSLPGRDT